MAHTGVEIPSRSLIKATGAPTILTTLIGSVIPASLFKLDGSTLGFIRGHIVDGLRLVVAGSVIEMGRRLIQWTTHRIGYAYAVRATFYEGDPAHTWITTFLQQQKIWTQSKHFEVTGHVNGVKAGVSLADTDDSPLPISHRDGPSDADYVPIYNSQHLFRWKSYWIEVSEAEPSGSQSLYGFPERSRLNLKLFTRKASVLPSLIAHAKHLYRLRASTHIIVHTLSTPSSHYFGSSEWPTGKYKLKRPLSSVVLPEGTMDKLLGDLKEFLNMGDWYRGVGIPYRRGYLLFGPPGTGKTSTVHALAGELNLEIYSLSLSSPSMTDDTLQASISTIPKRAILLIEDIDCAFSASRSRSKEKQEVELASPAIGAAGPAEKEGSVTLSGLLNALDGIGSEESRIFFATTNHIETIDPALIRPGRIDVKIQYQLACPNQIKDLFLRFYPKEKFGNISGQKMATLAKEGVMGLEVPEPSQPSKQQSKSVIEDLANTFTTSIPTDMFSVAELQGFLLNFKDNPVGANEDILEWVKTERISKQETGKLTANDTIQENPLLAK